MNRRGFLGSILALGAAPAIVKAELLMPVRKIVVVDHASMLADQVRRRMAELKEDMERELMRNQCREDLADMIWDIQPYERPFIALPSGMQTRRHEWTVDILRPANV